MRLTALDSLTAAAVPLPSVPAELDVPPQVHPGAGTKETHTFSSKNVCVPFSPFPLTCGQSRSLSCKLFFLWEQAFIKRESGRHGRGAGYLGKIRMLGIQKEIRFGGYQG